MEEKKSKASKETMERDLCGESTVGDSPSGTQDFPATMMKVTAVKGSDAPDIKKGQNEV